MSFFNLHSSIKQSLNVFSFVICTVIAISAEDVIFNPGYITGEVSINDLSIYSLLITAKNEQSSSSLDVRYGPSYTIPVNTPDTGTWNYTVTCNVTLDGSRYIQLLPKTVDVSEGNVSTVDFIENELGMISGTITNIGDLPIHSGRIYARQYRNGIWYESWDQFRDNGQFSFPVLPYEDIRINGTVYVSAGTRTIPCNLEVKKVSVDVSGHVQVDYIIDMSSSQLEYAHLFATFNLQGFPEITHYSVRADGPTTDAEGNALGGISKLRNIELEAGEELVVNGMNSGRWSFDIRAGYASGGYLRIPAPLLGSGTTNYYIHFEPGETNVFDINNQPGWIDGCINVTGVASIQDAEVAWIEYQGLRSEAYNGYASIPVNHLSGAYHLPVTAGVWSPQKPTVRFKDTSSETPLLERINCTFFKFHYDIPTSYCVITGETTNGSNYEFVTGEITFLFRTTTGEPLKDPKIKGGFYETSSTGNKISGTSVEAYGPEGEGSIGVVRVIAPEGEYNMNAYATVDRSEVKFSLGSLLFEAGVKKVIDIDGPRLTIQSPAPYDCATGNMIAISGTATGDFPIASIKVNETEISFHSTDNPEEENEVVFSSTLPVELGAGTIVIVVTDNAGKYSEQRRPYINDQSAPSVYDLLPANESVVTDEAITITGKANDNVGVTALNCNGNSITFISSSNNQFVNEITYTFDVQLALGENIFAITTMDQCGNSFTKEHIITYIDNRPPYVNAGNNRMIASEDVGSSVITGYVSDQDTDDNLTFRWLVNGSPVTTWSTVAEDGSCPFMLNTADFDIGEYQLTLEANDGKVTVSDGLILTVGNSSPVINVKNGSIIAQINSIIVLEAEASDYDGDELIFEWKNDNTTVCNGTVNTITGGESVTLSTCSLTNLPLGSHTLTLLVNDGYNDVVSTQVDIEIVDNTKPTLIPISSNAILWPPNHDLVDIAVEANAHDNSGIIILSASICSDEPQEGLGDGDIGPDWTEPEIDESSGIITFKLRAERSGIADGRTYRLTITATDLSGNTSEADVKFIVPHDKGKK